VVDVAMDVEKAKKELILCRREAQLALKEHNKKKLQRLAERVDKHTGNKSCWVWVDQSWLFEIAAGKGLFFFVENKSQESSQLSPFQTHQVLRVAETFRPLHRLWHFITCSRKPLLVFRATYEIPKNQDEIESASIVQDPMIATRIINRMAKRPQTGKWVQEQLHKATVRSVIGSADCEMKARFLLKAINESEAPTEVDGALWKCNKFSKKKMRFGWLCIMFINALVVFLIVFYMLKLAFGNPANVDSLVASFAFTQFQTLCVQETLLQGMKAGKLQEVVMVLSILNKNSGGSLFFLHVF